MRFFIGFLLILSFQQNSMASGGVLRDGQTGTILGLSSALESVEPGTIVIVGENHGLKAHQSQQLQVLNTLHDKGLRVSVGMEFFTYTQQNLLDSYRAGVLSEADFLSKIAWGSPSFDFYRDQALFPSSSLGETTIALNAPRSLTGKVAKLGLVGLSDEERKLLPPQFAFGRASYKERFLEQMKPHLPNQEAGERYFEAQSIWDDTMAWQATDFIQHHPSQVLVIIVGEFHVQYGGGLPDRIRARAGSATPVLTISQFNSNGLNPEEVEKEVLPSTTYGPRADFIWVQDIPQQDQGL